ncbi:putative HAT dimerization domain, ribonuclease H-like superfamily, hAT-like transposase, RNase-H [Helianthus annuus]|nr:putative HAT dimerization domain, ribonuclease H-like superfamily, hAT-like transposase, RNase-H [Helianthus annuus]KAJ0529856.1 putative HAT dimerization domain, ribonuclease H-like superfamily, hAT-like transposase, RNase-H [Helianthus annuus]
MVVTGHFIDDDWVMHKRIINFRPIDSHKGDDIARELLDCIHGWGIKNVMTMTLDNASSNDKAVGFLVKKLHNLYDGGKHFHIRCMAHILNLIVKDGLMENNCHVDCLRNAISYIRKSTQRIKTFRKCMKDLNVDPDKFLCGDMPTRWNSTYEMLKIAVDLKEVFFAYELKENNYHRDLERVPEPFDFDVCKVLIEFLEKFKIKTEIASASSKPLAHLFFREILDVDKHLRDWAVHPDFCLMAGAMRDKYDKYWGKYETLNDFMYFAVILDPTMKLHFIEHCFTKLIKYDITKENPMSKEAIKKKVSGIVLGIENRLHGLFETYKEKFDKVVNTSTTQEARNEDLVEFDVGNDFFAEFLNVEESNSVAIDTELKRYLQEPRVDFTKRFDILTWWKQNAIRFPIVSRMARDILAIQISTVASESAFSTSGRVLDAYRTRLSTNIVEALVCTQDWVRKSRNPIVDDVNDILKDDDIAIEIEDEINKQKERGMGKMQSDY